MPLRVGQKVAAARPLGTLRGVPKGATGTVVGVSFYGTYDVNFGEVASCTDCAVIN
jgi:hypothetical protein